MAQIKNTPTIFLKCENETLDSKPFILFQFHLFNVLQKVSIFHNKSYEHYFTNKVILHAILSGSRDLITVKDR